MKKSRIICSILAALFVLSVFAACGETGPGKNDPDNTGAPITNDEGYTMRVPKQDHKGAAFTVLSCQGENTPTARYWTQFSVEEDSNEQLDSALFKRNKAVEEYLGIDIEFAQRLNSVVDVEAYRTGVITGDDEFQLAAFIDRFALGLAMEGYVLSFADLQDYYVDLSNPWWDQEINKELSISNKQYLAAGAYQLDLFGAMTVLLFNKQIAEDNHLDNIYELVRKGEWTMEKMAGMMSVSVSDVDGDQTMTNQDVWGAVAAGAQWNQSFFPVSGETIIKKDKNDIPYLAASGNRNMLNIVEYQWNTIQKSDYFYQMDAEGNTFTTSPYWDGMIYTAVINMFSQGKALFASAAPMYLVSDYLRKMEDHFGIVPYPTFKEVKAGTNYGAFMPVLITHVVPYNTSDPELASAFLEYTAFYSYENSMSIYEDTVISVRGTRDEESGEMLSMMRKNRKVDLARTYFLNTAQVAYNDISKYGSFVWASGWRKHEDSIKDQIDGVVLAFAALK
ncbi:MAG: hypothetical protein IJU75_00360 [Clostridia bacterium]|nr:hypothetical protein [Clostridia bacterium]